MVDPAEDRENGNFAVQHLPYLLMTRFYCLLAGLLFCAATTLPGQTPNRPAPNGIPAYTFVLHDSTYQGYYLTTPFDLGAVAGDLPAPAMVLDSKGYLLWYMLVHARNLLDFKFDPGQQVYQYIKFQNPQQVQCVLLDTGFNPVDSFTTTNGILPDVHDFQITKNNTFLVAGASDSLMDLHAYLFGATPGSDTTHAIGFVVQEFDAGHNLLFQWNSNDYIHPGQTYAGYGYNPGAFDYCHGNAIEEDYDGNLLLSFRNLNAVYKVDRHSGEVLWQLGGNASSFQFTNDPGFSGQHDVRRLPNGHISIFDNANQASPPRISRAVEYQLDTVNHTATRVWEYRYAPGFFSSAMGNHQVTADRRHLINYGLNFRPDPSFVLIDDAKNPIAELFFPDSFMSYRSFLYDLPLGQLERPAISCAQNGGVITLSAPPGFANYAWSTGESAASIQVQGAGTYQVWVSHGLGMLGSEPLVVADPNAACPVSGVSAPAGGGEPTIVAYYDLLGRAVAPPQRGSFQGRLYAVRFSDGSVRVKAY